MTKPTHFLATLKRGQTYYLGANMRFERGKPKQITAAQKKYLEQSAVDRATLTTNDTTEVVIQQKFSFEPIEVEATPESDKGTLAEQIAAMQGDGGVSFEDDDVGEENEDTADTADSGDEDAEEDAEAEQTEKEKSPPRRRSQRNK